MSSDSEVSFTLVRRVPRAVKQEYKERFHPYISGAILLEDVLRADNADERIDAYDDFSYNVQTYVGTLRRYQEKRRELRRVIDELTQIEMDMAALKKKTVNSANEFNKISSDYTKSYVESDDEDEEISVIQAKRIVDSSSRELSPEF